MLGDDGVPSSHAQLATFGILHGRSIHDGVVDLDRLADAIRLLDPSILGLQEVNRDQPRSHLADLTAVFAESMGAVTHRFAAALLGTPGATWIAASENDLLGVASYGIALLSRYPSDSGKFSGYREPTASPVSAARPEDAYRQGGAASCCIGRLRTQRDFVVANAHLSYVPGWGRLQLRRIGGTSPLQEPVILMVTSIWRVACRRRSPATAHWPGTTPSRSTNLIASSTTSCYAADGHVTASSAPGAAAL